MASSDVLIHNNCMMLLKDLDVSGKRVFVRADLDVSLERIEDRVKSLESASRLQNLKPTMDWLLEHGARQIVIAGHIGRPEKPDPELSTEKLLPTLAKILGREIEFSEQPGNTNQEARVILLENLRFWPGEEANDFSFAKELAALADVYVNDAFSVCHRKHASVVALAELLQHAAGLHLEE